MDSASLAQVAVIGGLALGSAVLVRSEFVRRFGKRGELPEQDVLQAQGVQDAMRVSGRVRPVSARTKPEWVKRLERRWVGMGRLGERKLKERSE
jgi:hypothetical protein